MNESSCNEPLVVGAYSILVKGNLVQSECIISLQLSFIIIIPRLQGAIDYMQFEFAYL